MADELKDLLVGVSHKLDILRLWLNEMCNFSPGLVHELSYKFHGIGFLKTPAHNTAVLKDKHFTFSPSDVPFRNPPCAVQEERGLRKCAT